MSNRLTPMTALSLILPTALLVAPSWAQDALGDGQGLDANPRVGGGGRNVPRMVEDFRARNRLVTGEVGDGREFRGEVGYVGERAFASPLPTDEFFRFQSTAAATSIQNVLSGRAMDRFSLAAGGGVFAFDRDFTAPMAGQTAMYGERFFVPERAGLDAMSRATTTGRMFERSSVASLTGSVYDEAGDALAVVGSPIFGLRFEQAPDGQVPTVDLPLMDVRAVIGEFQAGVPGAIVPGQPFRPPLMAMVTGGVDPEQFRHHQDQSLRAVMIIDPRVDRLSGDPDYDAIVRRVIEQYGADPTVVIGGDRQLLGSLQQQLDELRRNLELQQEVPSEIMSIEDRLAADEAAEAADAPAPDLLAPSEIDERLLRALRHGRTVEDLTPVEQTRLAQMLGRGEQLLSEGQFMLAERYFDRALRFVPLHPMAMAGLVNTQLAAGLHLSAAVNLHQLIAVHPEMIDVRYGERILPPAGRLEIAVDSIRRRLARSTGKERVDYGLLLAYIGHQTSNRDLVLEGLEAIHSAEPRSTLLAVLEAIWLGD